MKMIKNLFLSLLCLFVSANVPKADIPKIEQACPEKAFAKPKKPRKLLVFTKCKGFVHSSIPYCTKAFEIMGKKTGAFEIVQSDDFSVFEAENLKQFDAVCFNNTTALDFNDPNLRKSILDFVSGGKGIIGIHAATDNFYNWPEAAELMGGYFDGHPWVHTGTWAVKIEDKTSPVNGAFEGKDFKISDEIYRIKPLNLYKNCHILLSLDLNDPATRNANGVKAADVNNPVSWIRTYQKGRVFYCGLGHNHEVYWNPAILKHYLDGIQYAMGDLEADAAANKNLISTIQKSSGNE